MSYYQTIYNTLRASGLTEAGALGFLGNWDCESNCEPYRLQGDFSPYRTISHQYTEDVESGKIPMSQFAHDSKGYGLAQWTYYTRKEDLYDFWKQSGKLLDNVVMQTDFALWELATQGEYATVSKVVKSSNDIYECVKIICYQFERPAVPNVDARYQAALRIRDQIDLDPQPVPPEPEPSPEPTPEPEDHSLDLRTIDKNCSGFDEVFLLQSALLCRKYLDTTPTDIFGSWLEEIVKQFQADNGLDADGVVGPKTWNKLL